VEVVQSAGSNAGGGGGAGGLRSTVTATGGGGSLEPAYQLLLRLTQLQLVLVVQVRHQMQLFQVMILFFPALRLPKAAEVVLLIPM
jgi:hypothetical protein